MSPIYHPPQTRPIKQARLLVRTEVGFHRLARISWSNRDASLYISPRSSSLPGRVGLLDVAAVRPGQSAQVTFRGDYIGCNPYLSLHQSGQAHGHAGPSREQWRTGAVRGHALNRGASGHLATIAAFQPATLPLTDPPAATTKQGAYPLVVDAPSRASSAVLVLHACPTAAALHRGQFTTWITLARKSAGRPLHIGISARWEPATETHNDPVVIIYGGWGLGVSAPDRCVCIISPAFTDV
jgi:hypothetical protein